jgi:DNA repair exonuclease SbcCD ATPase subunit
LFQGFYPLLEPTYLKTMKTPRYRIGKIAGTLALGGFLLGPLKLAAQDIDNRPAEPAPPRQREATKEAPEALRIQPMLREMEELLRAGKLDEVLERAARIRDVAKDNPRLMNLIERAMGERNPKPDTAQQKPAEPGAAGPPPRMKIQHLREAAEHLNAAGYEKLADQARAEIGRIEAETKRQQTERQHAESSREAGPDANAAIKAEMNQLHRELEDLRNQLRHLKADAAHQRGSLPQKPPNPPLEQPR